MLIASEYIDNGINLYDYFQSLDVQKITIQWLSNFLLQGISIILVMFGHSFYHNDFNYTNILVVNTDTPISLDFPLFGKKINYNLRGQVIPLIKLIDFDLASIYKPRNNDYKLDDITPLPLIDIISFVCVTYRQVLLTFTTRKNND